MIKRVLGFLLMAANSHPPFLLRNEFYALKTKLLKRFGHQVGTDLQHIFKRCFSCDGTGIHDGYRGPQTCWKCDEGVYDEFWTPLAIWDLGGFRFHIPCERIRCRRDAPRPGPVTIEGLIQHRAHWFGREAGYWLFLLFDRQNFKRSLGSGRNLRYLQNWTPMIILSTLVFHWGMKAEPILRYHSGDQASSEIEIENRIHWVRLARQDSSEMWREILRDKTTGGTEGVPF